MTEEMPEQTKVQILKDVHDRTIRMDERLLNICRDLQDIKDKDLKEIKRHAEIQNAGIQVALLKAIAAMEKADKSNFKLHISWLVYALSVGAIITWIAIR
jgi:hypothetical protein